MSIEFQKGNKANRKMILKEKELMRKEIVKKATIGEGGGQKMCHDDAIDPPPGTILQLFLGKLGPPATDVTDPPPPGRCN